MVFDIKLHRMGIAKHKHRTVRGGSIGYYPLHIQESFASRRMPPPIAKIPTADVGSRQKRMLEELPTVFQNRKRYMKAPSAVPMEY